jgi:hypothetical protein
LRRHEQAELRADVLAPFAWEPLARERLRSHRSDASQAPRHGLPNPCIWVLEEWRCEPDASIIGGSDEQAVYCTPQHQRRSPRI